MTRVSSRSSLIYFLIYLLIFVQLSPASLLAAVSSKTEIRRLGIVRLPGIFVDETDRAFPLLEKRIQRGLENLTMFPVEAEILGPAVAPEISRREATLRDLKKVTDELLSLLGRVDADPVMVKNEQQAVEQLRKQRQRIPSPSPYDPWVQKSLIAEAAYVWQSGDRNGAMLLLRQAGRLHLENRIDLEEELGESAPAFELAARQETKRPGWRERLLCTMEMSVTPKKAQIEVNGFPLSSKAFTMRHLGPRQVIAFPAGRSFLVTVSLRGYQPVDRVYRCGKPERRFWKVSLFPPKEPVSFPSETLSDLVTQRGLDALFLIESERSAFRFSLFSPALGRQEMALRREILAADVLRYPDATDLPVAEDTLVGLLKAIPASLERRDSSLALNRRLVVNGPQLGLGPKRPGLTKDRFPRLSLSEAEGHVEHSGLEIHGSQLSQWYNSWVFWSVVGGVTTGIAMVYLATREHTIPSRGGIAVKLD